jgi:hypothetical protein
VNLMPILYASIVRMMARWKLQLATRKRIE